MGAKTTPKAKPAPKQKAPTLFEATADLVLAGLAENKSLRAVCSVAGMPSISTVLGWLDDPEKAAWAVQYTRTRARAYEQMADEIIEISDEVSNMDGGFDNVARARLRVDSRKWMLSKMLPKVYGDKVDVAHTGNVSVSLTNGDEQIL